jgi:ParB family chromosome partitioning protein
MATTVKLSQIKVTQDWNRESVGDISGLVTSIKENGQLQPLLVWQDPTAKGSSYFLIDGRRRFAALQVLKKDPLIVVSTAKNSGAAFLQSMAANLAREENTPYEIARSFDQLNAEYSISYDAIAKVCGKTTGYVGQHVTAMRIAKRNPDLLEAFRTEKVSLYAFRFLARLDEKRDLKFFQRIVASLLHGASAQDVGMAIDQYLKKLAVKDKSTQGSKSRRGAAAHVKEDRHLSIVIPDYTSKDLRKVATRPKVQTLLDTAQLYKEKFLCAKSLGMQRYYQGCLDAINEALSLT